LDRPRDQTADLPHGSQVNLQRRQIALQLSAQTSEFVAHPCIVRVEPYGTHSACQLEKRMALAVIELREINRAIVLQGRCLEIDEPFDALDGL
jgi:hypothetical protein